MERYEYPSRKSEELFITPEEVDLSAEKFNVIRNITNTEGHNPVNEYVADFATKGGILLETGEAGSGKTTTGIQIEQAIIETAEKIGVKIYPQSLLFDKIYTKLEKEYGHRDTWPEHVWRILNETIYRNSQRIHPKDRIGDTILFTRIEFPMAGALIDREDSP